MSNDVAQNQEVDWSRETTDLMTNSNFTDTPEITREILTSDAVQQKDMYQETINRVIENLGLAVGNAKKKLDKSFEEKPMPEVGGFTEEGLEQEVEKFMSPTTTDKQTEEALTDAEIAAIASRAIDAAGKAQDNQPNVDDAPTGGLGSPPSDDFYKINISPVTKYDSMLLETGTEQVRGIQGVLTQLGYVPRGIDGVSGAGTEAALRSFQEQNDLTVTGLADADTISKLQSNTANRYTFSDVTDTLLEEFADVESDEAHLGTDFEAVGITLAYGIVPTSGLKYKHQGTIIDLPTNESDRWPTLTGAGVTAGNFRPSNVLIDDVVKDGVSRGDYRSDEEWTKAVITSFEDKVKARARVLDVDLSGEATEALTSYTWNTGSGTLEGDAMTTAITELGNDNPDYNTIATGFMNRFTQRGGGILQSLGRRRANEANTLLEAIDSPWTIEFYRMQRTPQGREQFVFTTSEGAEMIVNADDGTRGMDPDSSFPTRNLGVN